MKLFNRRLCYENAEDGNENNENENNVKNWNFFLLFTFIFIFIRMKIGLNLSRKIKMGIIKKLILMKWVDLSLMIIKRKMKIIMKSIFLFSFNILKNFLGWKLILLM